MPEVINISDYEQEYNVGQPPPRPAPKGMVEAAPAESSFAPSTPSRDPRIAESDIWGRAIDNIDLDWDKKQGMAHNLLGMLSEIAGGVGDAAWEDHVYQKAERRKLELEDARYRFDRDRDREEKTWELETKAKYGDQTADAKLERDMKLADYKHGQTLDLEALKNQREIAIERIKNIPKAVKAELTDKQKTQIKVAEKSSDTKPEDMTQIEIEAHIATGMMTKAQARPLLIGLGVELPEEEETPDATVPPPAEGAVPTALALRGSPHPPRVVSQAQKVGITVTAADMMEQYEAVLAGSLSKEAFQSRVSQLSPAEKIKWNKMYTDQKKKRAALKKKLKQT